jgi:hypothetical protein
MYYYLRTKTVHGMGIRSYPLATPSGTCCPISLSDIPSKQPTSLNNVDLYFQQVIALKENIEPKTARRVVAALQCMARQEESLRFQIDNGANGQVFQALQAQTQRYALCMLLQNDVDAHANLPTNSMDEEEFERALDFVMENNKPYASDFILSWTGCTTATFARNDSLRKFNLEDACTDKCHGPLFESDNPVHVMDKWMMLFILQEPFLHKDNDG